MYPSPGEAPDRDASAEHLGQRRQLLGHFLLEDLERLLHLRKHKKPLTRELINTAIAGRDYQLQAIRSVMEGVAFGLRDSRHLRRRRHEHQPRTQPRGHP